MRRFGHIDGIEVGSTFPKRSDLSAAGIHRPLQAGISGKPTEGADSIVISGGYEDDVDEGDTVIYTGHGGNDPNTKRQVSDQTWTSGNAALAKNSSEGLPIRVTRGAHKGSAFAPPNGYRYDGLYYVERYWQESGKSGFRVCRFKLVRDSVSAPPWLPPTEEESKQAGPAKRQTTIVQRIVRNTEAASRVKRLYDFKCQVCGIRLDTPGGPYAEGAHIRPLGRPHDGPDTECNIICLCPNHHVLFDSGAFTISQDFSLAGIEGRLLVNHNIDASNTEYHRLHFTSSPKKQ